MATNYNNINELRSQKKLLKQEIKELEDILTFKSKKRKPWCFDAWFYR
jgi:hypothetical protein